MNPRRLGTVMLNNLTHRNTSRERVIPVKQNSSYCTLISSGSKIGVQGITTQYNLVMQYYRNQSSFTVSGLSTPLSTCFTSSNVHVTEKS